MDIYKITVILSSYLNQNGTHKEKKLKEISVKLTSVMNDFYKENAEVLKTIEEVYWNGKKDGFDFFLLSITDPEGHESTLRHNVDNGMTDLSDAQEFLDDILYTARNLFYEIDHIRKLFTR